MEVWQQILGAVGIGAVAVVAVFFNGIRGIVSKWLLNYEQRIGRDVFIEVIEYLSIIRRARARFERAVFAERILLLVAIDYNDPKRPCLVRAFDGWTKDKERADPLDIYGHLIKTDTFYRQMLDVIVKDQSTSVVVSEMPTGALLRRYYESEGVTHALLYYLREAGPGKFIYLSVASYNGPFTDGQRTKIDLLVDQTRSELYEEGR